MAHVLLLGLFDLTRRPILTLVVTMFAFAAFWLAARSWQARSRAGEILLISIVLRALLLPLPPTLSDDLLRYVWDGRVVHAGHNPYLLAPEAEELAGLRDDLWLRMPHRQIATVYPPLALLTFSIASRLPAPMTSLKILLTLADLLTVVLLMALLRVLGRCRGEAVWYAWNPLVTLEIAGMGHVDALVVLASVATVLLLLRTPRRPLAAAFAAAGGVLAKLVPLVALPLWARHSGQGAAFLALAGAVVALALGPIVLAAGGLPPGLLTYGVQWEFNGPLYEPLWRLYDVAGASERIKLGLDHLKRLTGHHEFWNRVYPSVYPQFLAKISLAAWFAVLFVFSLRTSDLISGTGRLFGAVLLCSATLYPWYLLWVLPWAVVGRHRAWLAAAPLLQLSYWPQLTSTALFPWCYLLIWGPFFILFWRSRWSTD